MLHVAYCMFVLHCRMMLIETLLLDNYEVCTTAMPGHNDMKDGLDVYYNVMCSELTYYPF